MTLQYSGRHIGRNLNIPIQADPEGAPLLIMIALTLAVVSSNCLSGEVVTGSETSSGLSYWEWHQQGVRIRLVQRLPDQTRAFFQGRGFSAEASDIIGRSCVFQAILRNDGVHPVALDLETWEVLFDGQSRPLLTREGWQERWTDGEVGKAARIALNWSLLPTRQRFEPGDYNWGMISFGLPPGRKFDLLLKVVIDGEEIDGSLSSVECSQDIP